MAGDPVAALSFRGPAEPGCLEHIHELLARLWTEEPGVADGDRIRFSTAVLEVATNVVQHSHGDRPSHGDRRTQLALTLRADAHQLEAVLVDDGAEVDVVVDLASLPGADAESGRGLALARAAVHELTHERTGTVNRWRLVRRRNDPPGETLRPVRG